MSSITLEIPDELLECIAQRAAAIVLERQASAADGWLRGAQAIADYIGAGRDRIYALSSAGRIPVHRDGATLVATRSELDKWIRGGGGQRP